MANTYGLAPHGTVPAPDGLTPPAEPPGDTPAAGLLAMTSYTVSQVEYYGRTLF